MFRRILQHDWRTLRADFTVWTVAVMFGASLVYGFSNGARWVRSQKQGIAAAQAEEAERLGGLQAEAARLERDGGDVSPFRDPRNPSTLGQTRGGRYAVLPPIPLAVLSIGQSDLLPAYYRMSTDARGQVLSATELENPNTLLTGRFDLSFVIIYLYPLLILALTYNLLSSEQEQGTLTLTLSQPVSLGTLVRAKLLVRGALIAGCALTVCVAGLLVAGVTLGNGDTALRIGLWALVVTLYGAFWCASAVVVASFGRPSATNAMALAGLWLLVVLLIPSAVNLAVTTLYPVPSRVRMVQAIRTASDEATEQGSRLLARYYEDHPELAAGGTEQAMSDFNIIRVAVNDEVDRRVRPVTAEYDRQLSAQQRAVSWLRFLSVAIVTGDALNDLAGTGNPRHRHFVSLVDQYHDEWRAFFVPLILQKARLTAHDTIPRFRFREEPLSGVVGRISTGIAALALPAVLLGLAGFWRIRRFAVVG